MSGSFSANRLESTIHIIQRSALLLAGNRVELNELSFMAEESLTMLTILG